MDKVRKVKSGITFNTNGGEIGTTEVAEFAPLEDEEIWFNNKGIANVLSMAKIVDRGNDVVYDSRKEDAFIACSASTWRETSGQEQQERMHATERQW